MTAKEVIAVVKETAKDWLEDDATRLAASLAFYTVLSMAPLLVLAVSVAGLVYGEEAAKGEIADQISGVVGPQAGKAIQTILRHAHSPNEGTLSSIIGIAVLLFGASGVFGELQASLNEIWKVAPKPGRVFWTIVQQRFFSFAMVLGVAFLLLVSLLLSTAVEALGAYFSHALPGGAVLWEALNFVFSLGVVTGLFALIFKVIPDAEIGWRDVWIGALFTALLFTVGKSALGWYLARASVASPYGAAGSLIVFVVWVYYAAQILFMGAEFTQVFARHLGHRIAPSPHAVPVTIVKKVLSEDGSERIAKEQHPRTS
jgi:membrane protein